VRFAVAEEHRSFAESIHAAIGSWEPPREPGLGLWQDDRDDALARRLAELGWGELWADPALLGAAVAGGTELGRACAPVSLVDEAALGAPLWVGGRARHAAGAATLAVPLAGGGLGLARPVSAPIREATLDGSGTVRVEAETSEELPATQSRARWSAWSAVTLAYLAGLAGKALELAVEHARAREQFGAPLGSLPAVQARLADAKLAVDGMELVAWSAAESAGLRAAELTWSTAAAGDVTASAHQVHGAVGFALETGLHRYHRRAQAVHAWTAAVCAAARVITRSRDCM
jgi:hypothetical protein